MGGDRWARGGLERGQRRRVGTISREGAEEGSGEGAWECGMGKVRGGVLKEIKSKKERAWWDVSSTAGTSRSRIFIFSAIFNQEPLGNFSESSYRGVEESRRENAVVQGVKEEWGSRKCKCKPEIPGYHLNFSSWIRAYNILVIMIRLPGEDVLFLGTHIFQPMWQPHFFIIN